MVERLPFSVTSGTPWQFDTSCPFRSQTTILPPVESLGMTHLTEQFDHPAWLTAAGTLAGYGLILLFMFLLLFIVPYLLFPA